MVDDYSNASLLVVVAVRDHLVVQERVLVAPAKQYRIRKNIDNVFVLHNGLYYLFFF